jgi:hypothetical protein
MAARKQLGVSASDPEFRRAEEDLLINVDWHTFLQGSYAAQFFGVFLQ